MPHLYQEILIFQMKTITIQDEDFENLLKISQYFYEMYGDGTAHWNREELADMCYLGKNFMDIVMAGVKSATKNFEIT